MALIEDFYLKRNDTREPIEVTAEEEDENGVMQPIILPNSTTVEFHMVQAATNEFTGQPMPNPGAVKIAAGVGYLVPSTGGGIGYQWTGPDTNLAGTFLAEFQLTFADGRILTFPNNDNITVHIRPDLA